MAKRSSKKSNYGCGIAVLVFLIFGVFVFLAGFVFEHPVILVPIVIAGVLLVGISIIRKSIQRTTEQVNALSDESLWYLNEIKASHSASSFVDLWDSLDASISKLSSFMGKNTDIDKKISSIIAISANSQSDFQWWLRNAIERQEQATVKLIKNDYRNSKEHRQQAYYSFCSDIQSVSNRFSDETREFADESADRVFYATGLPLQRINLFPDNSSEPYKSLLVEDTEEDTPLAEIQSLDFMNGREFEFWCADLLRRNRFNNVSVTQGSGDQGVDVLAEKDGIRYAFQCKCYSSDLGNKPIQEVHAGKEIYNCHIGVVMTNRHFTKGAIEAARRTNTLLWDRDVLQKMIETRNETSEKA